MADYFIIGRKGAGKTLAIVDRIARIYLPAGRRVATNIDLFSEHLTKYVQEKVCVDIIRLSDKPRFQELEALGYGTKFIKDESTYGAVVIDEAAMFLNPRTWNEPGRIDFINWLRMSRHYGWNVYYLIQDIESIDTQMRKSFCEHYVICRRLDKLRIPFIGWILKILDFSALLPKIHWANVHYGQSENEPKQETWLYTGKGVYNAYDTNQIIKDDFIYLPYSEKWSLDNPDVYKIEKPKAENPGYVQIDMRCSSSVLPAKYITGELIEENLKQRLGDAYEEYAIQQQISKLRIELKHTQQRKKNIRAGKESYHEEQLIQNEEKQLASSKSKKTFLLFFKVAFWSCLVVILFYLYPSTEANEKPQQAQIENVTKTKEFNDKPVSVASDVKKNNIDNQIEVLEKEKKNLTVQQKNHYFASLLGGTSIRLSGSYRLGDFFGVYIDVFKPDGMVTLNSKYDSIPFRIHPSDKPRQVLLVSDSEDYGKVSLELGLIISLEEDNENSKKSFL